MSAFAHMSDEEPQVLLPDEAAARLRSTVKAVRRACARGELQAVKFAGRWLINRKSLDAYLAGTKVAPSPQSAADGVSASATGSGEHDRGSSPPLGPGRASSLPRAIASTSASQGTPAADTLGGGQAAYDTHVGDAPADSSAAATSATTPNSATPQHSLPGAIPATTPIDGTPKATSGGGQPPRDSHSRNAPPPPATAETNNNKGVT